jgi:hypothetical protein
VINIDEVIIIDIFPLKKFPDEVINLTRSFKLKSLFMDYRSILQIEPLELLLQKSDN